MNIDLAGRKAIVTSSTAGIDRATAEGLVRDGAAITVNGRTLAGVDAARRVDGGVVRFVARRAAQPERSARP